MGKAMMGSKERLDDVNLMTPQQMGFLQQAMNPQNQQAAGRAYSDFLQPYNPQNFQDLFQKSFIDPAQQSLQRDIIPGIKESFLGMDESGSSALNQALAQSATDVSTGLGQQYMNFYNQQQQGKLGALQGLGGLAGQRTFEPAFQERQGLLSPLLGATGQALGGYWGGRSGGG